MNESSSAMHRLPRIFWALSITAIVIWSLLPAYVRGWDIAVYKSAILSVRAGHDPYADAMALQRAYQMKPHAYEPGSQIPYSYVYSPITLPVVRLVAKLPFRMSGTIYWSLYVVGAALIVWVGMRFIRREEASVFHLLAPVAIFFPGLVECDTLFCGNIAIILYALVLCAAMAGWKRGQWSWYYAAVLLAGCCKAPMLSLLVIPIFSARRQWLPAAATGAMGIGIFLLQPKLWPTLFQSYLEAVDLQFRFNRDFGQSPAGVFANALFFRVPYRISSLIGYAAYAIPIAILLFYFSRKFLSGRITLKQWAPLLIVGTILLNPRIMEYDLIPITLPMALLLWRFLGGLFSRTMTIVWMSAVFLTVNALAFTRYQGLGNSPGDWAIALLVLGVFAAGSWNLWTEVHHDSVNSKKTPSSKRMNARV